MPSRRARSRERQRLGAATGARERPRERVVAVDRRALRRVLDGRARRSRADESRLSARDTADSRSTCTPFASRRRSMTATVARCRRASAARPDALEEIAEQRDGLRRRHRVRGAARLLDCRTEPTSSGLDAGELDARAGYPGRTRSAMRAWRSGRSRAARGRAGASRARRSPRPSARAGRPPRRARAASRRRRPRGRRRARVHTRPARTTRGSDAARSSGRTPRTPRRSGRARRARRRRRRTAARAGKQPLGAAAVRERRRGTRAG